MGGELTVDRARAEDLAEVERLLDRVALPREGVREHFDGFVVARDEADVAVGCVGIERYGPLGLLRSVAVDPGRQGQGLGYRLTAFALDAARVDGVEEVVLLTTTARDFFADKFGFEPAERVDYDERLTSSPEWSLPRCSSAAFLRRRLLGPDRADG